MRKCGLVTIITVLAVVITVVGVIAQEEAAEKPRVTIVLKDAPIRSAIETLFRGTGYNFTLESNITGTVSVHMNNIEFDSALRLLLKTVDPPLTYRKEGDVYMITSKKDTVMPEAGLPTNPAMNLNPVDTSTDVASRMDMIIEKIPLNFLDAYDLKAMIEGNDTRGSQGIGGSNSGFGGFNNNSSGGFNNNSWGGGGFNNNSIGGGNSWGGGSNSWGGGSNFNTNTSSGGFGRYGTRTGY